MEHTACLLVLFCLIQFGSLDCGEDDGGENKHCVNIVNTSDYITIVFDVSKLTSRMSRTLTLFNSTSHPFECLSNLISAEV